VNVLVPWLLFCIVFALFSFSVYYEAPITCCVVTGLLFIVTVGMSACLLQMARVRREKETEEEYEPMWYGFLCVTCMLAIFAGIICGCHNFDVRMVKFYDFENLATYRDIDPASYVGQQLVDAGRVQFNDKTYLDIGQSMGFKDNDVYCVAPIKSPNTTPKTFVDFWAVGKNCCSGTSADFHCEGFNARDRGGLRLMDDAARPFYRLAVQQAEAMHKISTHKPLFFIWGKDPVKYTEGLKHDAIATYITGIIAGLCLQCFLVVSATLVFAKIFPTR